MSRLHARSGPTRSGISFIEVTISVAILITALAAVVGNIHTLSMGHRVNQEVATVSEITRQLVERIQALQWNDLASSDPSLAWMWSRQAPVEAANPDPTAATVPPMTQTSTAALNSRIHNLLIYDPTTDAVASNDAEPVTGLLPEPSGLDNLRVWVEYRKMAPFQSVASRSSWLLAMHDDDNLIDPRNVDTRIDYLLQENVFDPATFDQALLVRVVARWDSVAGGQRHYEVSFARRR